MTFKQTERAKKALPEQVGISKAFSEIQRLNGTSVYATAKSSNGLIGELEINIIYKQIFYILGMIDENDESHVLEKLLDSYLLVVDVLLKNMSELYIGIGTKEFSNEYKNLYKVIETRYKKSSGHLYRYLRKKMFERIKKSKRNLITTKLHFFEEYLKKFKNIVVEKIDDNSYLFYTKYKGSGRKLNEQVLSKDERNSIKESLYHAKSMVKYYYENKKFLEEK